MSIFDQANYEMQMRMAEAQRRADVTLEQRARMAGLGGLGQSLSQQAAMAQQQMAINIGTPLFGSLAINPNPLSIIENPKFKKELTFEEELQQEIDLWLEDCDQ